MDQLICKACDGKKKERGCPGCGGYGYVAERRKCPTCERTGYFRPINLSLYEGKRYYSIDGLEMVAHMKKPDNCNRCEEVSGD